MIRKITLFIIDKLTIIYNNIFTKNKIKISACIEKSVLKGNNYIYKKTIFRRSVLGIHSYIGELSYFTNTEIGNYCSIASNVKCIFGRHPSNTFISTHPYFYSKNFNNRIINNTFEEYKYVNKEKNMMLKIGNDVWIGSNVLIMDGITIGNGAIIGAGAVVTKDVPDYSIVCGVPAKVIKYRFDKDTIDYLNDIKWWDKSEEWINNNYEKFNNINEVKELLNNEK